MFRVFESIIRTTPIPDGHVSISPRGSIALSADLGRSDLKSCFAEFAYDDESKRIRLRLMRDVGRSGYSWRLDRTRWRIEPLAAMKLFGLCPPSRTLCPAKWADDALMVELSEQVEADRIEPVMDRPANGRPPWDDGGSPMPPKGPSKYGVTWAGRIKCPNCDKEVAYRWVKDLAFMRKHANCDATLLPEGYVDEPSAPLTAQDPPEPAGTPNVQQCVCAVCGGRFPLVASIRGLRPYSHRVGTKICKGMFQSPRPDEAESEL